MQVDLDRTRRRLKDFDFRRLFIEELGWDRHAASLDVPVNDETFALAAVAQKRGMVAFICAASGDQRIPDYPTRRKIERQVTKSAHEHLIIYTDAGKTTQVWQWVKREPGKPAACREHTYNRNQPGDLLIQKLQAVAVSLEEEESLTLPDVTSRVRAAFDVERVTKRFYDRFKAEHAAFLKFLKGIPDEQMERWYVSVMLNRLMFIYFIQKKGFLDGDADYLLNKLAASKDRGKDLFYREFLCPLFFEGFAKRPRNRSAETNKLLGKVPYLNGGLFLRHQIEEQHGQTIRIADAAFEQLFRFFDQYQWHLDERPLRKDDEINPDVLGYIFEKYINQKQMGAYYTKEDITGYISRNTVIPFLFDAARKKCKIAFEGSQSVWRLLTEDPNRYIYPAVQHGVNLPLPEEIAAGIEDVSKRTGWNRTAPAEYALPTEIWREVVARRQRYQEVRDKLTSGEVRDVNDLITLNLDIEQFAQDVIENCEGPELLRAFWHAIEKVTVLDPTCGSGAFLFAALNILESLYEACLDRMQVFMDELERSGRKHRPEKSSDFRKVLEQVEKHPSRKYFVFKSIVINNLYGVDIMEEAIEICKLRLFLKLVAQIDRVEDIEPLPDIDFNIRAGNTLVGYATYDSVKRAVQSKLDFDNAMARIEQKAADVDRLFALFRQQQTELNGTVTTTDKQKLQTRLKGLENELNGYLATEYGVDPDRRTNYAKWLTSHKPFHWFVEFYGIMKLGGFDVVIGNPPWAEYSTVKKTYTVRNYETERSGNLHALCTERSLTLRSREGSFSFIVQLPLANSSRMDTARSVLRKGSGTLHVLPFDDRPGKLFEGLQHCRSVIFISRRTPGANGTEIFVNRYQRWATVVRKTLFQGFAFTEIEGPLLFDGHFPKLGSDVEQAAFGKVALHSKSTIGESLSTRPTNNFVFYQEATGYWVKAVVGLPYYAKNGKVGEPAHGRFLYFDDPSTCHAAMALLNSSIFYAYFIAYGDCFHLSDTLATCFPAPSALLADASLVTLGKKLDSDLRSNAERMTISTKGGDKIAYEEYFAWKSKPIIDEIDRVLAKHYGFTDEELDFIINYDIKYRIGLNTDDDQE